MKRLIILLTLCLTFFTTCDSPMGMGDIIDLEPPILRVKAIETDGLEREILEENGKIFIGPGILFGYGAILKGDAWDNVGVEEIRVIDITNRSDPNPQVWSTKDLTNRKAHPEGWQEWSMTLEGIKAGERVIEITAYDRASLVSQSPNIGPETVKQLTMLVDVNPPFVESIRIERQSGIFADLLPRDVLEELDPDDFDNIDFFQNEQFSIRASIKHDFGLSGVTLNFIDDQGKHIFGEAGRNFDRGTNYTPIWDLTAADFAGYPADEMTIFKVIVTARAEAEHTGSNDVSNSLFNLCWYPDSDYPKIHIAEYFQDRIDVLVDGKFPMHVFDDDQLDEVYHAIYNMTEWANIPGSTNGQKLDHLNNNRNLVTAKAPKFTGTSTTRSAVIPVTVPSSPGEYRMVVIAIDAKQSGAPGVITQKVFNMNVTESERECDFIMIISNNTDKAYVGGETLTFRMVFSSRVKVAGTAQIRIQGGSNGNVGGPVTINFTGTGDSRGDLFLTGTYNILAGVIFNPVRILDYNISGVQRVDDPALPIGQTEDVVGIFNNTRDIKVMSVIPVINTMNNQAPAQTGANITVLAPRLSPNDGKAELNLVFNTVVYPESGIIRIRPAAGWLIPPVLTNAEFSRIYNVLNTGQQNTLNSYYTKTTHGLRADSGNYVPDTATKYVLNFDYGLDQATLRNIFELETVKYMWQEIDVHNSAQVTGTGTNTIKVILDPLHNGLLWKVEIIGNNSGRGAFRDEAGNELVDWGTATTNTFWSQTVSAPVIRVERVSNNRAHAGITTAGATFQTNVRYRIDSQTPGAAISYGEHSSAASSITNAMTSNTTYRGLAVDGDQNSNIANATLNNLDNLTLGTTIPSSAVPTLASRNLRGTANLTDVGTNNANLYEARKDYIVAQATRNSVANYPNLSPSARGNEGAFKTIIVYRNMYAERIQFSGWASDGWNYNTTTNTDMNNRFPERFIRFEGANLEGAATTIAGFPLTNNNMTGTTAKYAYRVSNTAVTGGTIGQLQATGNTNHNVTTTNNDWIWITWEIVSNFWHVGLGTANAQPNSPISNSDWNFPNDWPNHSFRKYGNWGLRVRH